MSDGSIASLFRSFRVAAGLPAFLRRPLDPSQAKAIVAQRMRQRDQRFLTAVGASIYDFEASPYLPLLRQAGCDRAELQRRVNSDGIETTLRRLAEQGVRISLEEFKGLQSIERGSLVRPTSERDFDHPQHRRGSLDSSTSGSRARGTRVGYNWPLITEHAVSESVLWQLHQLDSKALILWLPPLPSIAGMQYALMSLKWRHPPAQWFSPVDLSRLPRWSTQRLGNRYLLSACRWLGHPLPAPEFIDFDAAATVARAVVRHAPCVLRTYASSAVRVARAAIDRGWRLDGCTMLSGGEPLLDSRRAVIEASGANVFSRYSATEAGLIGASCPYRDTTDEMHIYQDRIAVIEFEGRLLVTTLSPHASKVLLNVDIGDQAVLRHKACACWLGQIGMTAHVASVRSALKFTAEGMNVVGAALERLINDVVVGAGGGADDWQFREEISAEGSVRVAIVIDPALGPIDEHALHQKVLQQFVDAGPGGALTAEIWNRAGTLLIERQKPQVSARHKQLRIVRR